APASTAGGSPAPPASAPATRSASATPPSSSPRPEGPPGGPGRVPRPGSQGRAARLPRGAEDDRRARRDVRGGAYLLQELLQLVRRPDAHLEDVALLPRHRMARLDRLEMGEPLGRVVGRGRVDRLDRHER